MRHGEAEEYHKMFLSLLCREQEQLESNLKVLESSEPPLEV